MASVVSVPWKKVEKERESPNSPTFTNNQTSLPMALKKLPFEKSLPPSQKHLFHPPFQRQRKKKISHLTPETTILERG
jgi:hypothetical protein